MTISECQVETIKHIERVRKYIRLITDRLTTRGEQHDVTKLVEPEVQYFADHTAKLATTSYDSPEYRASLEELKPALIHHYANNRHHPEHFPHGVNDMHLVDIIEMFCDWKASSERHNDGNLLQSIETNAERFNIGDQLKQILLNTAKLFDEQN